MDECKSSRPRTARPAPPPKAVWKGGRRSDGGADPAVASRSPRGPADHEGVPAASASSFRMWLARARGRRCAGSWSACSFGRRCRLAATAPGRGPCWRSQWAPCSWHGVARSCARPRLRSLPVPVGLAGVLIGGALGWAWMQTIASPWLAHPVWSWTVAYGLGAAPHPSIDPAAGRAATLRFLSYVGVFWLCFALARDRHDARRLLTAILIIVAAYAAWGLIRFFAGIEHLFWHVRSPYPDYLTSTLVNRNHAATYFNIGAVIAFALLWERMRAYLAKRRRGAWLAAVGELLERDALLVIATLCLVIASLLTGSRGGLLSLGAGVTTVRLPRIDDRTRRDPRRRDRRRDRGADRARPAAPGRRRDARAPGSPRSGDLPGAGEPPDAMAELCRADPTAAARGARPRHLRAALPPDAATRASSASGIPRTTPTWSMRSSSACPRPSRCTAACCCSSPIVRAAPFSAAATRRSRSRRSASAPLVGTHALVDFSLQIPAVAITYAAILGIGCAKPAPSTRR